MIRTLSRLFHVALAVACGCSDGAPPKGPLVGNSWTSVGTLTTGRARHTTQVLGQRVLIIGGVDADDTPLSAVEVFDSVANRVLPGPSLAAPRWGHSITLLGDGRLLLVGGIGPKGPLDSVEVFDPSTGTWSLGPPLSEARYLHTAVLLADGRVLVAGGLSGVVGETHESCELFDTKSQIWAPGADLSEGRAAHRATLLTDGRILVTGGLSQKGNLRTSEIFTPKLGTWMRGPDLAADRVGHATARLLDGRVLVVGGGTSSVELFEPKTGLLSTLPGLPGPRSHHSLTTLPDGRVLLVGGVEIAPTSTPLRSVLAFDPQRQTWDRDSTLLTGRAEHQATLLASGQVLVSGGQGGLGSLELSQPYSGKASDGVADLGDAGVTDAELGPGGDLKPDTAGDLGGD